MDTSNIEKSNQLSFLKSRDPSIISANPGELRKINLALHKFQEESTVIEEENAGIKIYLRLKNTGNIENLYKIDGNEILCYTPSDAINSKNVKEGESVVRKYTFSHIFHRDASQEKVFNYMVKPKLFKFINGENSTLMTYGASGSGKTFTIVGNASEPGLVPRALEYLFRTLSNFPKEPQIKPTQSGEVRLLDDTSRHEELKVRTTLLSMASCTIDHQHIVNYREMQQRLSTQPAGILDDSFDAILGVWVSFAEIYNECIHDLLTPTQQTKTGTKPKLQLGSFNENTYIKNLTNVSISSGMEAYQILQYGLHNLNYAATSINSHSSRSHSIFTIKIAQLVKNTTDYRLNYFNFCDLAGSEKLKKTLNAGDRLKESNSINSSLLVLGRCISCIRASQKKNTNKIIPFRDSKLTRLFQRALTGHETLSMVVNMNPAVDMFDESQHALNFSALAKNIVIKQQRLKVPEATRFSNYIQSRSTAYPDIKPITEESEIYRLQDIIDQLHCDIDMRNRDFAEYESKLREELVTKMVQRREETDKYYLEQIAEIKENQRKHVEMILEKHRNAEKSMEIINLDSSSDENTSILSNEASTLKDELIEWKSENCNLKMELANYKGMECKYSKKIDDFKTENVNLEQANTDLNTKIQNKDKTILEQQKIIDDAQEAYEATEATYLNEISELRAKIVMLEEQNSDLGEEIQEHSKMYKWFDD